MRRYFAFKPLPAHNEILYGCRVRYFRLVTRRPPSNKALGRKEVKKKLDAATTVIYAYTNIVKGTFILLECCNYACTKFLPYPCWAFNGVMKFVFGVNKSAISVASQTIASFL